MLASMRAELLVLRKWPAACGLLLVTPALVLLSDYVAEFISYLNLTPADYATYGTPSQAFGSLTPSQFNIIAVNQFNFSGTAPFIVLGAVMAGSDWGRGTITTALLQRPGRAATSVGQVLALAVAITGSVLATFAVAATASGVIRVVEARSVNPSLAATQPALIIAESAGAALFVALTYGMLGLLLGTVCRSGAGPIAVGLLWTLVIEGTLYNLALDYPQGALRTISDLTPGAAASVVTGFFGDPGGGADSQNYMAIGTSAAVATLAVYMAGAVALSIVIVRRRDAVTEPSRRRRTRSRQTAVPVSGLDQAARRRPPAATGGVLGSLHAELTVMCKRPAIWALALLVPADMLLSSYFSTYFTYATANSGGMSLDTSPPLLLRTMMPSQYLSAALNGTFGTQAGNVYGVVVFMLLGALIGGSDWGRGTIKTALLQGPSRLRAFTGQALAVAVAVALVVAASVLLTFILAAAASAVIAVQQTGSLDPAGSLFPAFPHLAEALAAALVLALARAGSSLRLFTLGAFFTLGAVGDRYGE